MVYGPKCMVHLVLEGLGVFCAAKPLSHANFQALAAPARLSGASGQWRLRSG